jgi:hypothetical protein
VPSSEVTAEGWTAPGFGGVAEAFAENFRSHGDKGASVGVYVEGELKADRCCDPRHRVGFGYVQNQLLGGGPDGDPRIRGLIAAVARAIGA